MFVTSRQDVFHYIVPGFTFYNGLPLCRVPAVLIFITLDNILPNSSFLHWHHPCISQMQLLVVGTDANSGMIKLTWR